MENHDVEMFCQKIYSGLMKNKSNFICYRSIPFFQYMGKQTLNFVLKTFLQPWAIIASDDYVHIFDRNFLHEKFLQDVTYESHFVVMLTHS